MQEIPSISNLTAFEREFGIRAVDQNRQEESFGRILANLIENADQLQKEKESAVVEFVQGRQPDIHKTMIAIQKADVSFKLMAEVVNRARRAYEEVRNMQI